MKIGMIVLFGLLLWGCSDTEGIQEQSVVDLTPSQNTIADATIEPLVSVAPQASTQPTATKATTQKQLAYYSTTTGEAINGYDAVAYFEASTSTKGSQEFSANWSGSLWLFANEANKNTFLANPGAYAPQYGGYCSYAASLGALAPTDPNAWTVHNGKLYLNASLTVRTIWLTDKEANIVKADKNWVNLAKYH